MDTRHESEVTQSCLTFCNPMDCSPPGSSVHGIPQTRILDWVAVPSFRDLPDPEIEPASPDWQVDSLPLAPPGRLYLDSPEVFSQCPREVL